MKKKVIILFALLVVVAGCGAADASKEQGSETDLAYPENMGFELVYESPRTWYADPYYAYYRDRITDVMYVWVCTGENEDLHRAYMSGGLSVMLDPDTDGPLMYDRWVELTEQGDLPQ